MATITLTPISGAHDDGPPCYLLEIDDFVMLLDAGWTGAFDTAMLEPLKEVAERVDAVLVSHCDVEHLGALPYAMKRLGLSAPVYATLPVSKMGQMCMYDAFQNASRHAVEPFELFDLDDVDRAFQSFTELKYSQQLKLSGKGAGITVTPLQAGHMIGGALWHIKKDTDEIVYAVDYNHVRESLLDGCVLSSFRRPALLITSARNALTSLPPRRERDHALLDAMMEALRRGGDVLIPVDTAGRVLELLLLLEAHWKANAARLRHVPVVLLHHVAFKTLEFARSEIEWMSRDVVRAFDEARKNPFQLSHVHTAHEVAAVAAVRAPKVLLVSEPNLEGGMASLLLPALLSKPESLLLLTNANARAGTPAHALGAQPTPAQLELTLREKQLLVGEELERHRRKQQQLQRRSKRARDEGGDGDEGDEGDEGEEGDDDDDDDDGLGGELEDELLDAAVAVSSPGLGAVAARGDGTARGGGGEGTPRRGGGGGGGGGGGLDLGHRFVMLPFDDSFAERDEYGAVTSEAELKWYADNGGTAAIHNEAARATGAFPYAIKPDPAALLQQQQQQQQQQQKRQDAKDLEPNAMHLDVSGGGDEAPFKWVATRQQMRVRCAVRCVDLGGLSDGRSMATILAQMAPQRTVLVRGDAPATAHLADEVARSAGVDGKPAWVATPQLGEQLDLTSDTDVYRAKLDEALLRALTPLHIGGYEVSRLRGVLQFPPPPPGGEVAAAAATATATATTANGAAAAAAPAPAPAPGNAADLAARIAARMSSGGGGGDTDGGDGGGADGAAAPPAVGSTNDLAARIAARMSGGAATADEGAAAESSSGANDATAAAAAAAAAAAGAAAPAAAGASEAEEEEEAEDLDPATLGRMTVPNLKKALAARGLEETGKKAELVERLKASIEERAAAKAEKVAAKTEEADAEMADADAAVGDGAIVAAPVEPTGSDGAVAVAEAAAAEQQAPVPMEPQPPDDEPEPVTPSRLALRKEKLMPTLMPLDSAAAGAGGGAAAAAAASDSDSADVLTVAPLETNFISAGETRLADFKQLLAKHGLQAEFAGGGSLVVNSRVIVRKQGPRDLAVEGHFSGDYLKVRELLYGQFQVI